MAVCDVMRHYEDIAREQGKEEGCREIAMNMLSMGMDENTVARATKVPVETVREWVREKVS